jgi:ribosomal-protein-alanine N-acetyltransferase
MNANPQPALRDGDLLLRPLRPDDAPALWAVGQSEDIGHYTSIAWPFTPAAAEHLIAAATADWAAGTAARFAIIHTPADQLALFAGTASLLHLFLDQSDAEVAYWLSPAARGRGLARRAVALLCDWAQGPLGLRRLHLLVDLDNAASHAVALACGFRPTVQVPWSHPTDPGKDAICLAYERLAGHASSGVNVDRKWAGPGSSLR